MTCCPPPVLDKSDQRTAAVVAPSYAGIVEREWAAVPAGQYCVGAQDPDGNVSDGEGPPRTIELSGFSISATVVTNREFAAFVADTDYRTEAEQIGWSFVFQDLVSSRSAPRVRQWPIEAPWWKVVEGACWRWPGGRGSHIRGKDDHPVVHVSWRDAIAYCAWSGTRLPTEAEWEVAARGGLTNARYAWGDELTPEGVHMCNIWQGSFPDRDLAEDGFHGTCPVRSFPSNGYGLYEVAGNVWEWCADWWTTTAPERSGFNPQGPEAGNAKVMRGGSFLCHESYCNRYRVAARTSNTPESASSNISFRVVTTPVD